MKNNHVSGDGFFDNLMETITINLEAQFDKGYLIGTDYARSYTAMMQAVLGASNQFAMGKDNAEAKAITAREEAEVAKATRQTKIDNAEAQLDKTIADTDYVDEQKTQLIQSVKDNRKIKALDTLGDTYGTFGAGGITPDDSMWEGYYNIVTELVSDLKDYVGTASSSSDVTAITTPEDGDYLVCAGTFTFEGVSYVADDVLVYSCYEKDSADNCIQGRWKKSIAYLPSTTDMSTVE